MKTIKFLLLTIFFLVVYASFALGGCITGDCGNGRGTYAYSDNSQYIGQWQNSKRNGLGTLTRPSGSIYAGHWKDDQFNGQGTYSYPDGSEYIGQWKNSKRNGKGRYISSSGSEYEGQWKNGKLIGKGILTTPDGNKFTGNFDENGKLIGKYLPLVKRKQTGMPKTVATNKKIVQTPSSQKKDLIGLNGMTFTYIPPGSFTMGSPKDEKGRYDNETQHQVILTRGFYMQTTEVTQGQWTAVMKTSPSFFNSCGDACPVEQVSWEDIQSFIERLNQLEGTNKYRLPTEAEWEYSCRAGTADAFANGGITELECNQDSNLDAVAWFCGNADNKTHPVAQKKPNTLGLYDMHGNVSELCYDWYGEYDSNQSKDPQGPVSGIHHVVRGGGWDANTGHCRSACRGALSPGERNYGVGFRLVKTP